MSRPDITPENAMRQAGMTANEYLIQAVEHIDRKFGDHYAENNHLLLASMIHAQAIDFATMSIKSALYEIAEGLRETGGEIASGILDAGGEIAGATRDAPFKIAYAIDDLSNKMGSCSDGRQEIADALRDIGREIADEIGSNQVKPISESGGATTPDTKP